MRYPDGRVRRATDADLEALDQLRSLAREAVSEARGGLMLSDHDHPDAGVRSSLEAALNGDGRSVAIIAEFDSVPAGYALIGLENVDHAAQVAVIIELFVAPWARELGIGAQIMDLSIAWSREQGCGGIDGDALPGDRATKNYFEAHGLVARSIRVHRKLTPEASSGT